MGMSSHVVGLVLPDETFKKMKKVYDTCTEAGVTVPDEVWEFFDHDTPNDAGMLVNIDKYVEEVSPHDMTQGFQVDVHRLAKEMPQVKTVLFYNSY